jgi:uncharacterized protein (DUF1697 family)
VALLRGINVGGNALVRMADLRACFGSLGFERVQTYIASGNVLFDADPGGELATSIEAALERRFELPLKVVVLDKGAYERIVGAIPDHWIGDAAVRANVAFVRPGTHAPTVVGDLQPDPAIEEVLALDGAILWATRREAINRSVIRKLLAVPAYKELTIRNLNTTLKLAELLAA